MILLKCTNNHLGPSPPLEKTLCAGFRLPSKSYNFIYCKHIIIIMYSSSVARPRQKYILSVFIGNGLFLIIIPIRTILYIIIIYCICLACPRCLVVFCITSVWQNIITIIKIVNNARRHHTYFTQSSFYVHYLILYAFYNMLQVHNVSIPETVSFFIDVARYTLLPLAGQCNIYFSK